MKIIGSGSALPRQVVTNEMLTQILDTSDEWIVSHTGIRERHIIKDERLSDLAAQAAQAALEDAKLTVGDLDLVMCTNVISDCITPGPACFVAGALGFDGLTLDVNGACTGFIQALDIADTYFRANKARRILVVAAEKPTHLADWSDRSLCVLFGDGAGAVVLEKGEESGLLAAHFGAQFSDEFLIMPSKRSNCPYTDDPYREGYMYMNGQEVYRFAVSSCISDLQTVSQKSGIPLESIDWFLLHQANQRILNAARVRLKLPEERFPGNIERLGNTSSACIPLLIDEMRRDGRLRTGQLVAMSAFGAGLSHGAAILKT
ncbi:MAG: beta-ketoacyl-ACP synthase 3 [Clostridiales bacterium]|nr:beta-ketoacyl-ACP synthase 3 [Clostridiales bacterium]